MNKSANILSSLLLAAISSILINGCAKIATPPGGPVDKTGPEIILTIPETLSTEVPLNTKLVFFLNEWYDRRSFEDAFFISPEPQGELKFKFKLKRVVLEVMGGLEEDRTYIVTIGSGFRDLNRNSMTNSHTIAFSTGSRFDHGMIEGKVVEKNASGLIAALYNLESDFIPVEEKGEYLTQTGDKGEFAFKYLPQGNFRLIIFDDNDNDRLFTPGYENLGLTYRDIYVNEDTCEALFIRLAETFESPPLIESINVRHKNSLETLIDRPLLKLPDIDHIQIRDTLSHTLIAVNSIFYHPLDSTRVLLFTDTQDSAVYQLTFSGGIAANGQVMRDSLYFLGSASNDTTAPKILEILAEGDSLQSVVKVFTSETLDSVSLLNAFTSGDSTIENTRFEYIENSFCKYILQSRDVKSGDSLHIDLQYIIDSSGNFIADSIFTLKVNESAVETDKTDLGSISGTIEFASEYPAVISLLKKGVEIKKHTISSLGAFKFEKVESGYYNFTVFIDKDENEQYDFGLIDPFRFAEQYYSPPDCVRVRERWESSGVSLKLYITK